MSQKNCTETTTMLDLGQAQAMVEGDQEIFNQWLDTSKGSRRALRKMLFNLLMSAKLYHHNNTRLQSELEDMKCRLAQVKSDHDMERERLLEASRHLEDAHNREVNENNCLREQVEALTQVIDCQADAQEAQNRLSAAVVRASQLGLVIASKT